MPSPPVVLLIEDNDDAVELTRRAFEQHGTFAVQSVNSGRAGLHALREDQPLPQLILLDLGLPDLPGLEVLETIKHDPRLAFLPVVVLTVSDDPIHIRAATDLGAAFFVTKPVRHQDFEAAVDAISTFWSLSARTPRRAP